MPFPEDTFDEPLVENPIKGNFYQSSSYYCSTFALVTTVSEDGQTNIGPYQLTFPFEVINDYTIMLCSRPDSNTVNNIRRTKKCVLNYIEYDEKILENIVALGYPGQTTEEKFADAEVFTLVDSPSASGQDGDFPKILKEAFQTYECTWDEERDIDSVLKDSPSAHLLLNVDRIFLKESWKKNFEDGGEYMPRLPLTFGFKGGNKFWFAEPNTPFWKPLPERGLNVQTVMYQANRIDDQYQFTREACEEMTAVPKAFLEVALYGTVEVAKERGVNLIDKEFVVNLNKELGFG